MNCSKVDWVNNSVNWDYTLTKTLQFRSLSGIDFGRFSAYDKTTKELLICAEGNTLTVYKGYAWDGCSVVGRVYETENTLKASLLHDILYQVGKQKGYKAAYTLTQADKEFLWLMKALGVGWFVRNTWWAGVTTFGALWKMGTLDQLIIEEK